MTKTKKVLLVMACAVILVVGSVMATIAYLTAQDEVVNTFTVGDVNITLDETDTDENGDPIQGNNRVKENEYHLLPGHEYVKDPTVHVLANSEDCYVRMLMTINKQDELDAIFDKINEGKPAEKRIGIMNVLTGYDSGKWILEGETENADNTRTYEFRYHKKVTKAAVQQNLEPLFEKVEMPDEITNDQLKTIAPEFDKEGKPVPGTGVEIKVVAEAIQADGFDDSADAAWDALK